MDSQSANPVADRHAIVVAIWLAGGLIAAVLVHYGLNAGRDLPILIGCGAIVAAFVAHVIVNAVYNTAFTQRELALALVLYGLALLAFAIASLIEPQFRARFFLPFGGTLIVVGVAGLFYMVLHYGMRDVFESFNVIRDAGVRTTPDAPQKRWRQRR